MSEFPLDLEAVISRDRLLATSGRIQIDTTDDDTGVTLGFGSDCGVNYVVLSPAEAKKVATALEETSVDAETATIIKEHADE